MDNCVEAQWGIVHEGNPKLQYYNNTLDYYNLNSINLVIMRLELKSQKSLFDIESIKYCRVEYLAN
jgi:hypothetical protein